MHSEPDVSGADAHARSTLHVLDGRETLVARLCWQCLDWRRRRPPLARLGRNPLLRISFGT